MIGWESIEIAKKIETTFSRLSSKIIQSKYDIYVYMLLLFRNNAILFKINYYFTKHDEKNDSF
mgnify:CR=1 FL=1